MAGFLLSLLVPFGAALFLAYGLTPLVIRGAHRAGVLDVPTDERRAHSVPIPRLGGIAVTIAIGLTWLGMSVQLGSPWNPLAPNYGTAFLGITLGAGIVFVAGLFDDVRGLAPRLKLTVQICAALVVVAYGLAPSAVAFIPNTASWHAGEVIGAGVLVFWIVGVTNAFNLIDGLDGLASSFALVAAGVMVCSSMVLQAGLSPILPTTLAGALLGFLRYNWSPARIFLGDAGSMTLGFLFAVLTVISATDATGVTYPIIPLFALAFPITDTLVAMARRWIRGVPFSVADGRHIHHQLRSLGIGTAQTVKLLLGLFSSLAATGLVVVFAPPRFTFAILVGGALIPVVMVLYGLRWLRYDEFSEFGASMVSAWRHALRVVQIKIDANEAAKRIERASSLNEIKEILGALASQVGLVDIELIGPGQREKSTPPSQQIAPLNALPLRLDYTFAVHHSPTHRITIRLWGRPHHSSEPHKMERVVARIGSAIETWYLGHIRPGLQDSGASESRAIGEGSGID